MRCAYGASPCKASLCMGLKGDAPSYKAELCMQRMAHSFLQSGALYATHGAFLAKRSFAWRKAHFLQSRALFANKVQHKLSSKLCRQQLQQLNIVNRVQINYFTKPFALLCFAYKAPLCKKAQSFQTLRV